MRTPNFFCVGVQKAGTTTLSSLLARHDKIFMPGLKEVHYFDLERNANLGKSWYQQNFSEAEEQHTYIADFTPEYFVLPSITETIRGVCGRDVKIIISLRHPVDRAYSQFNHYRLLLAEERTSFAQAIAEDAQERREKLFEELLSPKLYFQRSLYHEGIDRYRSVFGEKAVKIVFFEDLIKDQQATVDDICDFLELPSLSLSEDIHENRSRPPPTRLAQQLLDAGRMSKGFLKPLLPVTTYQSVRDGFINSITARPDRLDATVRNSLFEQYFKEDCERASEVLGLRVYV